MLAATSLKTDKTLEAVKLILLLISKEQPYPETLKTYLQKVIDETISLLDDPKSVASTAMPEAVTLALKANSDKKLLDLLRKIQGNDTFESDLAEAALSSLESSFDPACEPAYFSKEIYAAI